MTSITILGFEFHSKGGCSCGGHQTHKYAAGDFWLEHRVKKETYRLKKRGKSVTDWVSYQEMVEKLHELTQPNEVKKPVQA